MIAKKVAAHELHVLRLSGGGHTSDSGQSGGSGKRNSDELSPTGQTESSDNVEDDEKTDVGSAEYRPLPYDGHYDPSYHVRGADGKVP